MFLLRSMFSRNMWVDRAPTNCSPNWSFKASRRLYAGWCPSSTYNMSKPYNWINASHVDPAHMTWNARWKLSGPPKHEAGRQSRAATAQCQAFSREDVQKNRRRTRICIICLRLPGSMLDANEGYQSMIQSAWPRRSHYQPGTSNTHLVVQKTLPTPNYRAARAQRWTWMINQCPAYRMSEVE